MEMFLWDMGSIKCFSPPLIGGDSGHGLLEDFYLIWCNCVPEQNSTLKPHKFVLFSPPLILIFFFFLKTRAIIFVNLILSALHKNKLEHAITFYIQNTHVSTFVYFRLWFLFPDHTERYQKQRLSTPT